MKESEKGSFFLFWKILVLPCSSTWQRQPTSASKPHSLYFLPWSTFLRALKNPHVVSLSFSCSSLFLLGKEMTAEIRVLSRLWHSVGSTDFNLVCSSPWNWTQSALTAAPAGFWSGRLSLSLHLPVFLFSCNLLPSLPVSLISAEDLFVYSLINRNHLRYSASPGSDLLLSNHIPCQVLGGRIGQGFPMYCRHQQWETQTSLPHLGLC